MSFDLIIANPPYGKQCSLLWKITKTILPFSTQCILLGPRNTLKDEYIRDRCVDYIFSEDCFEGAVVGDVYSMRLVNEPQNKYSFEDIYFSNDLKPLLKAVQNYNRSHIPSFVMVDGSYLEPKWNKPLTKATKLLISERFEKVKDKTLKELVDSQNVFVKTLWCAFDGVHFNDCHDFRYNLQNKYDLEWNKGGHPIDLMVFPTKEERDNFRDWWYSCNKKRTGKSERIGLTNRFLDLVKASGCGGAGTYYLYFPNLDWSHPWTDKEILKEIGLPEDFLKKE